MGYIQKSLGTDEKVVSIFKIHSLVYIEYLLFFWLIFPIFKLIGLLFVEYGLTNKRVVFKKGMISRHTEEMRLTKIETVEVKQSILGRILGYGKVICSGTGTSTVVFNYVSNPLAVKKSIEAQLD